MDPAKTYITLLLTVEEHNLLGQVVDSVAVVGPNIRIVASIMLKLEENDRLIRSPKIAGG